jgi:hypothetical protein
MFADRSEKRVRPGIVGQARIFSDAPRTRFRIRIAIKVVKEPRKTEPKLLAVTDELPDLYQRARSDQVRFQLFGRHRARSQA